MPKRGRSEQHTRSNEEVEALLKECQNLEDRLALELAVYLGMRASEICHLRRDWIKEGEIRIPKSQPCGCSSCKGIWWAKSEASVRAIPIPGLIANDLRAFLELSDGFHLSRQALWQKVRQIGRRAKIKGDVYPHSLRATAATRLASSLTAPELCYTLGWASISMGEHYVSIARAKEGASKKIREMLK